MDVFPIEKLKQNGFCNWCGIETGDIYYIFCSKYCNEIWYTVFGPRKGKPMGEFDIPKDVYLKWFEEKTLAIENMSREEIEARIIDVGKISLLAREEFRMLANHLDKLTGRKGIPAYLKADRDKLITDPNIQVNWDGEPRKKEKKPKEDMVKSLLGVDMKELMAQVKGKKVEPKKMSLHEAIDAMVNVESKPSKPELTEEEREAKRQALRDKMKRKEVN